MSRVGRRGHLRVIERKERREDCDQLPTKDELDDHGRGGGAGLHLGLPCLQIVGAGDQRFELRHHMRSFALDLVELAAKVVDDQVSGVSSCCQTADGDRQRVNFTFCAGGAALDPQEGSPHLWREVILIRHCYAVVVASLAIAC